MISTDSGDRADAAAPTLSDEALTVARRAAIEEAEDTNQVGAHLAVAAGDAGTVLVTFEAAVEGYRGWVWSVTIARVDPDRPTVSEVVLLPGSDALLAPEWVPWRQRVQSGDLGVGDVLITPEDDVRVVPAYAQSDDPAVEDLAHELGIGRVRVMSRRGREKAAKRWRGGEFGPRDEMAVHAPGSCGSCAFYLPLAGSLSAAFGACGNKFSPADGHVVHVGYGCGAHSEARLPRAASYEPSEAVVDELNLEVHAHRRRGGTAETAATADDGPGDTAAATGAAAAQSDGDAPAQTDGDARAQTDGDAPADMPQSSPR